MEIVHTCSVNCQALETLISSLCLTLCRETRPSRVAWTWNTLQVRSSYLTVAEPCKEAVPGLPRLTLELAALLGEKRYADMTPGAKDRYHEQQVAYKDIRSDLKTAAPGVVPPLDDIYRHADPRK